MTGRFAIAPRIASVVTLTVLALVSALSGPLARVLPGGFASDFVLGARNTALACSLVLVGSPLIGLFAASLAALGPRALDSALSRGSEIASALPSVVLTLIVARASSLPGWAAVGLVLAVLRGLSTAQSLRAELRSLAASDFALAARALGGNESRLFVTHLLPHVVSSVASTTLLAASSAVALEAALSFLDVGRSFGPSWGALLATALSRHEPSAAIFVVVATAATMLALNVLATGLEARVAAGRRFV